MKKVFFVLVLLNVTFCAHSQFNKGRVLVGGALGVDFTKNLVRNDGQTTERYRTGSFTFEPQFAYFLANRFALGAGVSITNATTRTSSSNNISRSQQVTFNPMARYYLPSKLFFQAKFPLGSSSTTFENGSDISKSYYSVAGISIGVGYAIMLNSFVSIEPMLQFNSTGYNDKDSSRRVVDNSFNFRMGFQIYLGK